MLKKLLIGVGVVVVLIVAALAIVWLSIDSIAKGAIEKGGTYALGTPTTVSTVHVGLMKGEFSIDGLRVASPVSTDAAFVAPHFLTLNRGSTAVAYSTLRQPTVGIPTLTLDGIDVHLERRGSSTNYGTILESLKAVTGSSGGAGGKSSAGSEDGKKFVIGELKITNVKVTVDMAGGYLPGAAGQAASSATRVTIPIDSIVLRDVGQSASGGTAGVTMSQLTGVVVRAVLNAAAQRGGGLIPGDLLGDLNSRLGQLTNLDGLTKGSAEVLSSVAASATDLGKKLGEDLSGAAKDVGQKVGDTIKGIFPGGGTRDEPKKQNR